MAINLLSKVALGPGETGYKFEILRQPKDRQIYEAGLQLECSLFNKASKEKEEKRGLLSKQF